MSPEEGVRQNLSENMSIIIFVRFVGNVLPRTWSLVGQIMRTQFSDILLIMIRTVLPCIEILIGWSSELHRENGVSRLQKWYCWWWKCWHDSYLLVLTTTASEHVYPHFSQSRQNIWADVSYSLRKDNTWLVSTIISFEIYLFQINFEITNQSPQFLVIVI